MTLVDDKSYIVIHSAGSGEELARLNSEDLLTVAETHGTSVRTLKQVLAERMQLSRFRQRLLNQDTGELLQDDMILSPPMNIQFVKLEFLPSDDERKEEFRDACACGRSDEVEHILQNPQDPNDPHLTFDGYAGYLEENLYYENYLYGYMPLHVAVLEGHIDVVRILLEAGADTEKRADDGRTPLHVAASVAASSGNPDIARLLLQWGAEKEKQTNDSGFAPMHCAANCGHLEVVRLLLEWGADIEKPSNDGDTALHLASAGGHLEVVRLLLESGANKKKLTNSGSSVLFKALEHGHREVVSLLRSF